jgi:dipeptidase E
MKNENASNRVLLISNSTLYGSGYLDHAAAEICDFLGSAKGVLFVPYALYDRDAYASMAQKRFEKLGFDLTSIHTASDPAQALQ